MADSTFFGDNSRPIAQIVSRRHPLAFGVYATVMFLGLVFVFHWYGVHSQAELFPGVSIWAIAVWKWSMVIGGGGALLCIAVRPREAPHWPDIADLLHLEGAAAILAAFGMVVYLYENVQVNGISLSGPAFAIYLSLITAHVFRGIQAIRDAVRLERLSKWLHENDPLRVPGGES